MIRHPHHSDEVEGFPFLDPHYFGLLVGKAGKRAIVWTDGCIEAVSASSSWLEELATAVNSARPVRNIAEMSDALSRAGYEDLGTRRYDFRSGDLYWCAHAQAQAARTRYEEREAIANRHQGTHPPLHHHDWSEWERVGWSLRSASFAARLLGLASLESLVNEVLSQRFPDDYAELEPKPPERPASFMMKLRRLIERLELDPEEEWVRAVKQGLGPRVEIAHHKPRHVDSDATDRDSVELSELTHPTAIEAWLVAVGEANRRIFAAFGADVPPTHLPL